MKRIKILVEGLAGTGKTTISQLIEKTLIENGFPYVDILNEELGKVQLEKTYKDRINNMNKEKMLIDIESIQTNRESLKEE